MPLNDPMKHQGSLPVSMVTSKGFTSLEPNVLEGVLDVPENCSLSSQQEGFSCLTGKNGHVLPEYEPLRPWAQLAWPFQFEDDAIPVINT